MSSRVFAIFVIAVAFLLTACPPAVEVSVYNNTPDSVTLLWLHDQKVVLSPHSSSTLALPPVLTTFSVIRRGVKRDYAIHYPGKEFMYPSYRFGLQIQPSAKIYAVQGTMPATAFPSQPSGYPLVPHA
jgi:hypothetical protein